jgi:hypothetical protein
VLVGVGDGVDGFVATELAVKLAVGVAESVELGVDSRVEEAVNKTGDKASCVAETATSGITTGELSKFRPQPVLSIIKDKKLVRIIRRLAEVVFIFPYWFTVL